MSSWTPWIGDQVKSIYLSHVHCFSVLLDCSSHRRHEDFWSRYGMLSWYHASYWHGRHILADYNGVQVWFPLIGKFVITDPVASIWRSKFLLEERERLFVTQQNGYERITSNLLYVYRYPCCITFVCVNKDLLSECRLRLRYYCIGVLLRPLLKQSFSLRPEFDN